MLTPFSPPPGLNSDDTTFAAEGRWADGSNVRFWRGKPQVIGGWSRFGSFTLTGICTNILRWSNAAASTLIAFATTSRLQLYSGTTLYDISPVGLGSPTEWSLATYGDDLMAAVQGGKLYRWTGNTAVVAAEITQSPDQITFMLVTAERQVLAFGCNEEVSTTFNPMCIRGSDIEDPTNWTTSSTGNAFEHILDGEGAIVAARLVAGYVAVWTTNDLWLGQFVGDPGQTYRFDRVATNCGLTGPDAVTIVGQTAYWVASDLQIRAWAIGTEPTIMPCPVWKAFASIIDTVARSVLITAIHISKYNEVWFFYPHAADGTTYPSRAICVSLEDGTWFHIKVSRSACAPSFGLATELMADSDGKVYSHETGNVADIAVLNWFLTSADQYLDNSQRRTLIRGFIPDFEDQIGDVSLTLFTKDRPQSAAVTKGPYTLTTSTTKKDFRASGMIVSAKFSGASVSGSYMRLGQPLFDVVPLGER